MHYPRRSSIGIGAAGLVFVLVSGADGGCGGRTSFSPPPINLSVSINDATVVVPANGTAVNVPVIIVAPTETATFTISGLPAGVTDNYKESESNPSGLLTLVANSSTKLGTYMPVITVGSSGQTASVVFTLVISTPPMPGSAKEDIPHGLKRVFDNSISKLSPAGTAEGCPGGNPGLFPTVSAGLNS